METQPNYTSASDSRNLHALIISIIGLLIPAMLIVFLVHYNAKNIGHRLLFCGRLLK